jgi:succinyl-diaminopimelate desuccinylase
VTPAEGGALRLVERTLAGLGFTCHRLGFTEPGTAAVDNLYARIGEGGPHFCFAGHTDVVPVGEPTLWTVDPFGGEVKEGALYGRGAADMKGAVAAFIAAAARHWAGRQQGLPGRISLLLTGDEEGPAVNGTRKVLDWMAANGELPDVCLVGEPTNPARLGETIKIGRRGSLTATLTLHGVQGHVAYPHLAENPLHPLVRVLAELIAGPLDEGTAHFEPSSLQISSIDVGNPAANLIPAKGAAVLNIRFNDRHTAASLERWLRERLDRLGARYDLGVQVSGEAFLTEPGPFTDLIAEAVREITGIEPALGTGGGTSDARFIRHRCPVAEFGLVGATMHKADERANVADIEALARVYGRVLELWFARIC